MIFKVRCLGLGLIPSGDGRFELFPLLATSYLPTELHPHGCGPSLFRGDPLFIFVLYLFQSASHFLHYPFDWANGLRTTDLQLIRRALRELISPLESGTHLLSHAVSSIVPSAAYVLTVVFGMGTDCVPISASTQNSLLGP